MTSENDFEDDYIVPDLPCSPYAPDLPTDEQVRALLTAGLPDFPATVALGDRVLASAARRRARARTFGGAGALALLAGCALAIAPLTCWGGHASRTANVANVVVAPGASDRSPMPPTPPAPHPTTLSALVPSPLHAATSATSATSAVSPTSPTSPTSAPSAPALTWVNSAKEQAAERVATKLQTGGHDYSYMSVGLSGQNSTTGTFNPAAATDSSPIIVYRKPVTDPTLERDAINAAYPFSVVFRDSTLDASEQWFLGHRLNQDMPYWQSQGVEFATALENDGTITIFASDPAAVVSLLEAHYGYNGSVFVGRQTSPPSRSG